MTDPIADMLTRIRNAQRVGHATVLIPRSKIKLALTAILKREGFIEGYIEDGEGPTAQLKVFLKYDGAQVGAIRGIRRVSRPGRRVYSGRDDLPHVRNGLGVSILTTPRGILTDHQARVAGVGGEIICQVW